MRPQGRWISRALYAISISRRDRIRSISGRIPRSRVMASPSSSRDTPFS